MEAAGVLKTVTESQTATSDLVQLRYQGTVDHTLKIGITMPLSQLQSFTLNSVTVSFNARTTTGTIHTLTVTANKTLGINETYTDTKQDVGRPFNVWKSYDNIKTCDVDLKTVSANTTGAGGNSINVSALLHYYTYQTAYAYQVNMYNVQMVANYTYSYWT